MTGIEQYLRKYPNARPSTLRQIQVKAEKTAQLRTELDAVCDKTAKRMMEAPRETLIERLVRKMRSL